MFSALVLVFATGTNGFPTVTINHMPAPGSTIKNTRPAYTFDMGGAAKNKELGNKLAGTPPQTDKDDFEQLALYQKEMKETDAVLDEAAAKLKESDRTLQIAVAEVKSESDELHKAHAQQKSLSAVANGAASYSNQLIMSMRSWENSNEKAEGVTKFVGQETSSDLGMTQKDGKILTAAEEAINTMTGHNLAKVEKMNSDYVVGLAKSNIQMVTDLNLNTKVIKDVTARYDQMYANMGKLTPKVDELIQAVTMKLKDVDTTQQLNDGEAPSLLQITETTKALMQQKHPQLNWGGLSNHRQLSLPEKLPLAVALVEHMFGVVAHAAAEPFEAVAQKLQDA